MASQTEVAQHLGLTRQRVSELVRTGHLPGAPQGRLNVDECRIAYIRHLRAAASNRVQDTEEGRDLTAERTRLSKEQADRLEMENAAKRGELLDRKSVDHAVINAFTRVRARMLAVPSRLAPQVAATADPSEAFSLLEAAIQEALHELSENDVIDDATDRGDVVGRTSAPAQAHAQ
ncbi:MAG: hypothetical protein AAGI34_09220 [Pseudomonadota bacterium]